jgi:four helix bundle protein
LIDDKDSRGPGFKDSSEMETQIMLSGDLDYIDKPVMKRIIDDINEVERMLKALIKSLENHHLNP